MPYTAPALTVIGTIAQLTLADQAGPDADLLDLLQNAPSIP